FNFQQSILDDAGHPIRTQADLLNRANLGIEVMRSPNGHNFPVPLALTSPDISA
ncbi:MAG: Photosystem Q(B) protein 1, partial [Pseudanabaena sp. M34BS1SP1A06MG]|nr:Photosystem Q(B) protein 1 [Pseudanabaena sp. M34BS1SP1A06MG]